MASTGMALSGKFHVSWNGTEFERVGDCNLPDTLENEVVELISDKASRKEIVAKTGYADSTVTFLFNPLTYEAMVADKESGTCCNLVYSCTATDGGAYTATFSAKIVNVGGASGDVEGVMESFETTFAIVSRSSASGSLGTQAYN
jgi:hypothetical protein